MSDESANKMKIEDLSPIAFRHMNHNPRMEISISEASSRFPGFRFSPTDEELIHYYLTKKLQGSDESVQIIPVVDMCRHEPWDLPAESVVHSDNEWFFFSPRGRKYPNGTQSKRATQYGYWKAIWKERVVKSGSNVIGTKKTLVFHTGRAPRGIRTEWIMHEYSTKEKPEDAMVVCRLRKNRDFKLNHDDNTKIATSSFAHPRDNSDDDDGKQLMEALTLEGPDQGNKLADSYTHSIEPIDTDSDSDDGKTAKEFSHHHSSSFKKSSSEEEDQDCYADIMKDDIIKLDKSMPPFIGTANRRVRLPRQRVKPKQFRSQQHQFATEDIMIPVVEPEPPYPVGKKIKYPGIFMFLFLFMFILMLLLANIVKTCVVKRF